MKYIYGKNVLKPLFILVEIFFSKIIFFFEAQNSSLWWERNNNKEQKKGDRKKVWKQFSKWYFFILEKKIRFRRNEQN